MRTLPGGTAAQPAAAGGRLTGELMNGPEAGHDRRCLRCHKLIGRGEEWRKVHAPDHSYAVAVHVACLGVRR